MTLKEYKQHYGITYRHLAALCDCTENMITQVANGKYKPSFRLAVRIEHSTDGKVLRDNWYPPKPPHVSIKIGDFTND